jgi:hypothetical protein
MGSKSPVGEPSIQMLISLGVDRFHAQEVEAIVFPDASFGFTLKFYPYLERNIIKINIMTIVFLF